jgi:protein O-mannosyl-transferase
MNSKRKKASTLSAKDARLLSWLTQDVIWKALLITGLTFFIFAPSLRGTFIGDDSWYLGHNPLVYQPDRLWKAWFAPGSWVEFYPLEETVQWFQWQLWHDNTLGYHLTNVILHLISSLLVWRLLSKFGLRLAWLGGLLFAIHPENVDSVCEIVELKNTLCLPPFLIASCLYIDYIGFVASNKPKAGRYYLWSLAAFLVSMLCKISAAPFPAMILLYVWWKRGKIEWRDVRDTLPFFAISIALGLTTIWAGDIYVRATQHGPPISDALGGFLFRIALTGQTIAFYFARCFFPLNPMPIYPKWTVDPTRWLQFTPWVVIVSATVWLWSKRHGWGRHALLGLGFFLIGLAPFLGLHEISYMHATWILDHLLYIPIIGFVGLIVAACEGIAADLAPTARTLSAGVLAAIFALLIFQSNHYAGQFRSQESLARYNLQFYPQNDGLHNDYGAGLATRGAYSEALAQFQIALQLNPHLNQAKKNMAGALVQLGQVSEGISIYQAVLNDDPSDPYVRDKLADALLQSGRVPEAIFQYDEAIRLHQDAALTHVNLGTALCLEGKTGEGIAQFRKAVTLDPTMALAKYNLAKTLCQTGQVAEGTDLYRQAIKLKPDYVEAYNNLGIVLYRQGNPAEAREEFLHALAVNPNYAEARNNLRFVEVSMQGQGK